MKKALHYDTLDKNRVQCHVCNHHCTIEPGKRGICAVRENHDGRLDLLVYGKAISASIDPIEKKPLFHFLPGTTALSIATVGCNFRCDNCQNWQISQASKQTGYTDLEIMGEDLPPEQVVADAAEHNCASIAYTYTEPTIWMEYALDCMKLAHDKHIRNVWVSNGYMSEQTRSAILPYLDAINIDLKFFSTKQYQKTCGGRLDPILSNLKFFKQNNVWVEVTTLSIPTLSDDEGQFRNIADFIAHELGTETPWHVSAFFPKISYKLRDLPPTKAKTVERAVAIGKKAGLRHVYSGNVSGLGSQHTKCPKCGSIVIDRNGYHAKRHDNQGVCPDCGYKIAMII